MVDICKYICIYKYKIHGDYYCLLCVIDIYRCKKFRGDIRKLIYLRYTACLIAGVYKHTWLGVNAPQNAIE